MGRSRPSAQSRTWSWPLRLAAVVPSTGSFLSSLVSSFQTFQPVAVQPLVDHQRPCGPHDLHGLGPSLVEVADEQACWGTGSHSPALGAVDVVIGDVVDVEQALVHRDDVGVERGRRVVLAPGHLGDRADLAAELVAG